MTLNDFLILFRMTAKKTVYVLRKEMESGMTKNAHTKLDLFARVALWVSSYTMTRKAFNDLFLMDTI